MNDTSSSGTADGSTSVSATSGTTAGASAGTHAGSSSGGSSVSGSSSGADGSSSSGPAESSSSGGQGFVVLQNDVWTDGMQTAVQGGFVAGECWGSTYVPDASHYPLRIRGFQVLISGDVEGVVQPFEIGVWTVDENLAPDTRIATALAEFTASSSAFSGAEFDVLELDDIIVDEGSFAISMCLESHDGFPGIAADVGGGILSDRNWLFTGDAWSPSEDLGLTGNWIMRAIIEPQ